MYIIYTVATLNLGGKNIKSCTLSKIKVLEKKNLKRVPIVFCSIC